MSTYVLTSSYKDSLKARAVQGSHYDSGTKAWVVDDPDPRVAAIIMRVFPETILTYPELVEQASGYYEQFKPMNFSDKFDGPKIHAPILRETVNTDWGGLLPYQEADLSFAHAVLAEHGGAYLAWERGLGKTVGSLALMESLDCKRTMIVAPNTAKHSVWLHSLERYYPDKQVVVIPNDKKRREHSLNYVKTQDEVIFIVHYEALAIVEEQFGWKKLGEWDLVIADECHRISNTKAKMSKAIKKVPSKMRLGLSGTVIGNHLEELFSQVQWLFPKIYKSKWRDWNDRFLDYVDDYYGRICIGPKPGTIAALRDELSRFMVYRRKDDELDLPARTEETIGVDLSPKQRKAYDELVATCVTELDNGEELVAANALSMLTKLRRIATGLSTIDPDKLADSSKIDLAADLIKDDIDAKGFVVFTWYKATAHALVAKLKWDEGIYVCDGDVSIQERAEMIDAFNARNKEGKQSVFIGTIATLGESVNLQTADRAIFLDRSWNPGSNLQARDRIYRLGQENPVHIINIQANDTVDTFRVGPALTNKEMVRKMVLT